MVWSIVEFLVLIADDYADEDSIDALPPAEEDLSDPKDASTGPQQQLTESSPAAESIAQDAEEGGAEASAVPAVSQMQEDAEPGPSAADAEAAMQSAESTPEAADGVGEKATAASEKQARSDMNGSEIKRTPSSITFKFK